MLADNLALSGAGPSACIVMIKLVSLIVTVSCQKGPTRHAYAWQIGPFVAEYPQYIREQHSKGCRWRGQCSPKYLKIDTIWLSCTDKEQFYTYKHMDIEVVIIWVSRGRMLCIFPYYSMLHHSHDCPSTSEATMKHEISTSFNHNKTQQSRSCVQMFRTY